MGYIESDRYIASIQRRRGRVTMPQLTTWTAYQGPARDTLTC